MSFDDQIRDGLRDVGRAYRPGEPPVDAMFASVHRRRQTIAAIAGGGAAVAIAVVIALVVVLPTGGGSAARLNAADRPGGIDVGPPTGSATKGDGATTTTDMHAPTTSGHAVGSVDGGTIAPSGTAYSPPASIVYPHETTTAPHGPTTTAPPSTGDTVYVTQADNGKTFTLRKSQHLVVTLDDPSWEWSAPDTDNSSVLQRTAVSANPSSTHVTAAFDPRASGQAHVSASNDAPCRRSSPPCMVPTMMWQITVNVV